MSSIENNPGSYDSYESSAVQQGSDGLPSAAESVDPATAVVRAAEGVVDQSATELGGAAQVLDERLVQLFLRLGRP